MLETIGCPPVAGVGESVEVVSLPSAENLSVGIVGLGYVGLPLALAFGKERRVVAFDIDETRVQELAAGHDRTRETDASDIRSARLASFSCNPLELNGCDVLIVTVPTPVDDAKQPDLGPIKRASECVGGVLRRGMIVVFESTVYPGATEEVCVPIIERVSGMKLNRDFFVGYSPERINPGDRNHRLADIVKVTSGSTPEAAALVDKLYASIIRAGTWQASSIRVAEAAKIIENIQRDVNIALINELAVLFGKMGIDTCEVLDAAASKWNFLPFRPGLVGGHCIGVDPYYLTYKAQQVGHHPEIILAGRRVNDAMAGHVAQRIIRQMAQRGVHLLSGRCLVMGFSFKENCPDIRNTKVADLVRELRGYGVGVDICDPWVEPKDAQREYGEQVLPQQEGGPYDAVVMAVAHWQFLEEPGLIRNLVKKDGLVFDVTGRLPSHLVDARI